VNHPSEHFAVGDEVEVVVLRFDPKTERVSLGYKQLSEDPWTLVDKKYPLGSRVRGRVVSLVDYGAFVELEVGVEGLVHVSEMTWSKKVSAWFPDAGVSLVTLGSLLPWFWLASLTWRWLQIHLARVSRWGPR